MRRQQQYEMARFGTVRTERMKYAPLDEVRISFVGADLADQTLFFEVFDGAGRSYHRQGVPFRNGEAALTVTAGGTPGLHVIRVFDKDETGFHAFRMGSFVLEATTQASADGTDLDEFFAWLHGSLESSLDWALYEGYWVAGDKAGDNSPMNLAYPRFRLDSVRYLERAETLKGHIDLAYAHQNPDGSLYDHIYADGSPGWEGAHKIRSLMADLETGLIINVWQVWMATSDEGWMASLLQPMLEGWHYATTSPVLWSKELGLIKKPHAADEWDVQMGDGSCFRNENSRYVASLCDAVRLPRAADCLADMLRAVGRVDEADALREFASSARGRANDLLWDGTKYRHHVHIDPIEHPDFDEDAQLVMSNTWACNDGLASHDQAVAIIEEYERRLEETGDAYPWWSMQPGYPEGHFPRYPPGMYMNGGLFPWVGGQLCRACFQHGFAERGWRLFNQFRQRVKADDGACPTWYTLDGHAAMNTFWTTPFDAWGIAAWGQAAVEGLVGVVPQSPGMNSCRIAPQWEAGGVRHAAACIAFPASRTYIAYEYTREGATTELRFTGSGESVDIQIPVDDPNAPTKATLNGEPATGQVAHIDGADYWCLTADPAGVNTLCLD